MGKYWCAKNKVGMLFAFLLLLSGIALYTIVAGTSKHTPAFPGGDPFKSISGPSWDFEMEGVVLSSCRGNGKKVSLDADRIKCKPVKRGGITFVNYSQLVVENARIKLSEDVAVQVSKPKKGAGAATIPTLSQGEGFNAKELFNIFSDLAGGSKRFILGKKDLENGPLKARVIVKVTAFPLAIESRTLRGDWMEIRAGQALAEIGRREVLLSGGASVRVSGHQALYGKKIHCLGSFREFFVEGAYAFETGGDRLKGENGFFAVESGRICLYDREYNKTAKSDPLRINTEIKSHFSYRKEYFRLLTIFPVKPKIDSVSEI